MKLFIVKDGKATPYQVTFDSKIPGTQVLKVREYMGGCKSNVAWIDWNLVKAFEMVRAKYGHSILVKYGFKRILEGGHTNISQHYAGTALDMAQDLNTVERGRIRIIAQSVPGIGYVEPGSLTPDWVHIDVRKPGTSGYPALRQGDVSVYVFTLQDCLLATGYKVGLTGTYDAVTANAVRAYQKANKLTADGLVGPVTWNKLTTQIAKLRGAK